MIILFPTQRTSWDFQLPDPITLLLLLLGNGSETSDPALSMSVIKKDNAKRNIKIRDNVYLSNINTQYFSQVLKHFTVQSVSTFLG